MPPVSPMPFTRHYWLTSTRVGAAHTTSPKPSNRWKKQALPQIHIEDQVAQKRCGHRPNEPRSRCVPARRSDPAAARTPHPRKRPPSRHAEASPDRHRARPSPESCDFSFASAAKRDGVLAERLHQRLCLVHDATDVGFACIGRQFEQDVACLAFLGYAETRRGCLFIERADLIVTARSPAARPPHGRTPRSRPAGGPGRWKRSLFAGVVGLDLVVAHGDLRLHLRHTADERRNAALLELGSQEAAGRCGRRNPASPSARDSCWTRMSCARRAWNIAGLIPWARSSVS